MKLALFCLKHCSTWYDISRHIACKDTVLRRARACSEAAAASERKRERVSVRASKLLGVCRPCAGGRRREGRKEEKRSGRTPSQTWSESQSGKVIDTVQRIYGCIGAEERRRRRRGLSRVSTWAVVVLGAGVEAKVGMGQMLPSCRSLFFRVQGFKTSV